DAIADIPTLLLWGMKDPAFGPAYLERWQGLFTNAKMNTFAGTGHFVTEEQPEAVISAIREFAMKS
ncbi:MAG: alpha/beta fold hydrolase, partial [Chloroflexota bacterium]